MIKAVVFDCFGVLVTENWVPFKKKYFGHNEESLHEVTDLGHKLNRGAIDYDEFIQAVSRKAGIKKEQAFEEIDRNVVNEELFGYIEHSLKPRFKVGLLSNVGNNWLNLMFTQAQLALFDEISLSYETGYIKPDYRAYQLVAEGLGIRTEEAVFVDDQERHCEGARRAGAQAILYRDFKQFEAEAETALADAKG